MAQLDYFANAYNAGGRSPALMKKLRELTQGDVMISKIAKI